MYLSPKQTSRLLLEPLTLRDAKDWSDYFRDVTGLKYVGITGNDVDPETRAMQWTERQLWRYRTNQYGLLALRD